MITKCIAHRGLSGLYPENTLISFRKALEYNPDCLELDIHLTKDNQIVICHDTTLDRTTDGTGSIYDYTLEELKQFDASYYFKEKTGFQEIPTLDSYFDLIRGRDIVTLIEFKGFGAAYPGLEELLIDKIRREDRSSQVVVSGFNHPQMVKFKAMAPEMNVGVPYRCRMVNPGKYGKEIGMDYLHPYYETLDQQTVDEIHEAGLKINAWGIGNSIDNPEVIRTLMSYGVDGIMTNRADIMMGIKQENLKERTGI